jgi:hypothetical protein
MTNTKFIDAISTIFKGPCIVLISGVWESGKTDVALLIAILLRELGVVEKIATNIALEDGAIDIENISTISALRKWLATDRKEKLYILDEAAAHAFLRDASSRMNKAIVKLLPLLSHHKGRLILVTQTTELLDYILKMKVWLRGQIIKPSAAAKGKAIIKSDQIEGGILYVNDLPSCRAYGVSFDRYGSAPLELDELEMQKFSNEELELLRRYSKGETHAQLLIHPEKLNRIIRKHLKAYLSQINEEAAGEAPENA